MKYLGEISAGRNNNLNLLRMIAAFGVLVSHAWPIALGPGAVQPFERLTGVTLGSICVYVFFVISGFLITGSFSNRKTLTEFAVSRILRLFPGLVVSLLLVALIMGPIVSDLNPIAYLSDSETWTFLTRNSTLAFPQFTLPGVFVSNPYPTVEGSIWTLIHEAICYVGVFVVGVLGVLSHPRIAVSLLTAYILASFVIVEADLAPHPRITSFLSLSKLFAIGMLVYLVRDRVPMSPLIVIALIALAALSFGTFVYPLLFAVALSYTTFWIGYVPGGQIRAYNEVGDYSYGVYIYAFPAQGLAIFLWGPMGPWENILWSIPLTLLPSILSWHLIEHPALRSRRVISGWLTGQRAFQPSNR